MATISEIGIKIFADAGPFKRGIAKAQRATKGFSSSLKRLGK
jgi:hypothetical protein